MRERAVRAAPCVLLLAAVPVLLAAAAPSRSSAFLQPLTRGEMEEAQAIGVGCYWSLPGERATRFAAADDHAAVKIHGRVVRLRPAEGAKDMFPFTYDAWFDGDLRLTIVKERGGRRRGGVVASTTTLVLAAAGRTRSLTGEMECGD